jgi:threonine dehydrogenase-like Zn-dependent dehydrogenase
MDFSKEPFVLAGLMIQSGRIELVEFPEPVLGPLPSDPSQPGDIIFQPEITCLCGSDLPYFDGNFDGETAVYPRQTGHSLHEMVGTVIATNGKKFKAGDKVLSVPINQVGLFERFIVSEARAIPVDTRVTAEEAMLAQPLGTVIFALKKLPSVLDKDVVVVGQGPIGHLFNLCLRNMGAREIIGIDKLESRLKLSQHHGATHTVCSSQDDPAKAVSQITNGVGPDIVIEAVGHADQAFNLCIDLSRKGGQLLYFGVPPPQVNGIRWLDLFVKNLTVYTSVNPDFSRDFPLAMRWIGEGRMDVSTIITHRYPLAEMQQAFETFRDRRDGALKVIVQFPAAQLTAEGRLS